MGDADAGDVVARKTKRRSRKRRWKIAWARRFASWERIVYARPEHGEVVRRVEDAPRDVRTRRARKARGGGVLGVCVQRNCSS